MAQPEQNIVTPEQLCGMLEDMLAAAYQKDKCTVKTIQDRFNRAAEPALGIPTRTRNAWVEHPLGRLFNYAIDYTVNSFMDEIDDVDREMLLANAKQYLAAVKARIYTPVVLNV